jgi:DNA-directed RNA polymerase subunit K/omega
MEDFRRVNRYLGVIMSARRARELNDGVNFTPEMEGQKITTLVLDEYYDGKLELSAEEHAKAKIK